MGDIREISTNYRIEPKDYRSISIQNRKKRNREKEKDSQNDEVELSERLEDDAGDELARPLPPAEDDDSPHLDISA